MPCPALARACPTCGAAAGTRCRWLTATDPACDGRSHPARFVPQTKKESA